MRFVGAVVLAVLLVSPIAKLSAKDDERAQLPAPTGSFKVGRVSYHWIDWSRSEVLSGRSGTHRQLMVYIWYPIVNVSRSARPATYWPGFKSVKAALSDDDLKDMLGPAYGEIEENGLPQTFASEGARMPRDGTVYPVLIFSHGWGLQSPLYTAALEGLASHGYVVAAIDHPYDSGVTVFPDRRVVEFAQDKFDAAAKTANGLTNYALSRIIVMADDVRFVINKLIKYNNNSGLGAPFAGHLDFSRLGAFGHSIGGLTSARTCQIDRRVRACIDEDSLLEGSAFPVPPRSVPQQPFLLFSAVVADLFSEKKLHPSDDVLKKLKLSRTQYEAEIKRQQAAQNQQLAAIRGGAYRVRLSNLSGFTHQSFSDLPLLSANQNGAARTEAVHNFEVSQGYIRGFFDKYLKGAHKTVLDADSPPDDRVIVDRFGACSSGIGTITLGSPRTLPSSRERSRTCH